MPLTATSRNGESFLAFLRFLLESWPSLAARFLAMACCLCAAVQRGDGCAAVQRGDGRAMQLGVCSEAARRGVSVVVRRLYNCSLPAITATRRRREVIATWCGAEATRRGDVNAPSLVCDDSCGTAVVVRHSCAAVVRLAAVLGQFALLAASPGLNCAGTCAREYRSSTNHAAPVVAALQILLAAERLNNKTPSPHR